MAGENSFLAVVGGAASASNYTHCQLWNPAASGVVLNVSRLFGFADAGVTALFMRHHNTALTQGPGAGVNKFIGGGASVGELRYQANSSALGTSFWKGTGVTLDFTPTRAPLLIPAGYGLVVVGDVVNKACTVSFEWSEVPQ